MFGLTLTHKIDMYGENCKHYFSICTYIIHTYVYVCMEDDQ